MLFKTKVVTMSSELFEGDEESYDILADVEKRGEEVEVLRIAVDMGPNENPYYTLRTKAGRIVTAVNAIHLVDLH